MQSTFFRGTSHDQDARFANKNKQLLSKLKFPSNFRTKVDMSKVALETIKPWISQRITELLGIEDDVVVNLCFNMLSDASSDPIDPRELQINLTGFMGQNAKTFVQELWTLLISAQTSDSGIPAELLERYVADQKSQVLDTEAPAAVVTAAPLPESHPNPKESDANRKRRSPERRRSRSPRRRRSSRSPRHRTRPPRSRRSISPRSNRRRRSPERRKSHSPRRRSHRSRSRSVERRRNRDERRRRRRHRRRRSLSNSSSSASASKERSPVKEQPAEKVAAKPMDLCVAEDHLRILALRSIVVNKTKQKEENPPGSPIANHL